MFICGCIYHILTHIFHHFSSIVRKGNFKALLHSHGKKSTPLATKPSKETYGKVKRKHEEKTAITTDVCTLHL